MNKRDDCIETAISIMHAMLCAYLTLVTVVITKISGLFESINVGTI